MSFYNFKDKESGEVTEVSLRISDLDQYKTDNPNLEQVHLSAPATISGTKSAMRTAGKDWENHLDRMKKGSGRGNTINT